MSLPQRTLQQPDVNSLATKSMDYLNITQMVNILHFHFRTLGIDFTDVIVSVSGTQVKLRIW